MCGSHGEQIDLSALQLSALDLESGSPGRGRRGGPRGASRPTRRQVLGTTAVAAAALFGPTSTRRANAAEGTSPTGARSAGLVLPDGSTSRRHAMHVHSSGSEGFGSLDGQLTLAERSGCDFYWSTEHDWRVFALPADSRLPRVFRFTTLSSGGWHWQPASRGTAAVSIAELIPWAGSTALNLQIQSSRAATYGLSAVTSDNMLEGNVVGRQFGGPVTIRGLSGTAYYEIALQFSRHGANALSIVYRFGPTPDQRVRVDASTGHVYTQVTAGQTITPMVTPLDDLQAFFGTEIVAGDNSVTAINLQVSSVNGAIDVVVPRLDCPRNIVGQDAFDALNAVFDAVAAAHPLVTRRVGLEISGTYDHLNWFGPDATNIVTVDGGLEQVVAQIKAGGSVASYNHPYGTLPRPRDARRILAAFQYLCPSRVWGADVLELGYDARGGMTLDDHLTLGDLLWCNGVVMTANGVSDDHYGRTWSETFLTQLWGAGTQAAELQALRAGRATVTRVGYDGDLVVSLDGRPMGSVPVNSSRKPGELTITATNLPSTSKIQVVQGQIVDLGLGRTAPSTSVVELMPWQFVGGSASLRVPGGNAYYRVALVDANGSIRSFTNPVWSGVPDLSVVPRERLVG